AGTPQQHRPVVGLHRDQVRVPIPGTPGCHVKDINASTVTLDGVHAVAHVTRKVRRDPFPMATYVFVANQLHLPKGLSNVTLDGTLTDGTTFQSSTAILNVPYASRVSGGLQRYMGRGGVYKMLSRVEAKHPGTVAIPSSNAMAVSRSANAAPGRTAGLRVSYAPEVHAAAKQAERPAPRPVVSMKRAKSAATDIVTKLPTLLRHSMNDFLGHVGGHSSPGPARARHAG